MARADEYFDGVLRRTTLPVAVVITDHVGFKNEASGNRCKPADADAVLKRTVAVTPNQVTAAAPASVDGGGSAGPVPVPVPVQCSELG